MIRILLCCGCAILPLLLGCGRGVSLRVADEKDLAALVVQHHGQVVLVDCWANWCEPCVKQFPHTVALSRQHAARGLTVVSLNFNETKDYDEVLAFLKKQGATFENLLSRYGGGSDKAFEAFDIKSGALPYYMFFDRQGRLRNELGSGANVQLTPQQIDAAVEKLLAEPAAR